MSENEVKEQQRRLDQLVRTALERVKANMHRRTEYWRTTQHDPHGIAQAVYVALLEMENSITDALPEISSSNNRL